LAWPRADCSPWECALDHFTHSFVARNNVPRNRDAFSELDQQEQDHTQHRERDNAGEEQLGIHASVRYHEEIAEAGISANEFAHHRSNHRERDRYLQPAEDGRNSGATATFGMACDETRSGRIERENAGHRKIASASGIPTTMLSAKPSKISAVVTQP